MQEAFENFFTPFLIGFLVATGIGVIIGLEREFDDSNKEKFAGIRTFPLIAMFGFLVAFLSEQVNSTILIVTLPGILLFAGIAYYAKSRRGDPGLTTTLTLLLTFLYGVLAEKHFIREALAAAVITLTLLALKAKIQTFLGKITQDELYAFVKFTILSLLILPFLPDQPFGPGGVLNPYDIGLVVVIISSLSFVGYLLIKFQRSTRGILLSALFGGLLSSTAVAWVFSSRSKESPGLSNSYAAGILAASSIMFLRAAAVSYLFSHRVFSQLWLPCLVMAATGGTAAWILRQKSKNDKAEAEIDPGNPLNILNALAFGGIYVCILFLVHYLALFMGDKGLYISGLLSGLADVDAITISMSKYAQLHEEFSTTVFAIILALMSNTTVKMVISAMKGTPALRRSTSIGFIAIVAAAGIFLLIKIFFN